MKTHGIRDMRTACKLRNVNVSDDPKSITCRACRKILKLDGNGEARSPGVADRAE